MKIKKSFLLTAMAAFLLTGCSEESRKYDFSDHELSNALLVKESLLDSLSVQPAEKSVIQKFSNIDEYKYVFEHEGADKEEIVKLTTKDDIVYKINLSQKGSIRSEYSIYGIHVGDSKGTAEAVGKAYFGEEGLWLKDPIVETLSFGIETRDKGLITIIIDPKTGNVRSISLMTSSE